MKLAKIFINGTVSARKVADSGKTSYKLRNNSHSFYQIGKKKDSGQTFHGLVKNLKVFKRVLSSNEIMTEMSGMLSA